MQMEMEVPYICLKWEDVLSEWVFTYLNIID